MTTTTTGIPRDAGLPDGPPDRRWLLGEARVVAEPVRLALAAPRLLRAPRGDGRVVVDVPGWLASEVSMAPIRTFLRRLGHDARPWGLGRNLGDPEGDRHRLLGVVETAVEESGRPVALVGWSLGGTVSREVARLRPDLVHAVVTYGTPVLGGPTHTAGAANFGAEESARIERELRELDTRDPITVPITALFSRQDGVVDWRAQLDRTSRHVRHVEVRSTHLGLGVDPDVWLEVARALAS